MTLSGVFPPIPTPFKDDAIDHTALASNIDRWMRTRLAGLVLLGSNGEAPLLADAECDAILETARAHIPRERMLIAGVGRESTSATIAAARRAAQAGVDVVLARTPSFYKNMMTSDAFVRHYTTVADASPVPVLLYNVTMFTGVNLTPDAVSRLAEHPNIIGLKESNSDLVQLAETIARTPDHFVVLAGSSPTFYHALCAGASGAVLALAGVLPALCTELFDLVRAQRHAEALGVQRRITPLGRLLGAANGVAGLKFALDEIGFAGGPTRAPLGSVSREGRHEIREQLATLGVLAGS